MILKYFLLSSLYLRLPRQVFVLVNSHHSFRFYRYLQVADEIDRGGGLKLNLRVREMCKKYIKPHGPVLATLHVNVSNGRCNDVTKCKELLAFLKEQVLPKTLKMISVKTLRKIKNEEKSKEGNWLQCIWPGKTRKRFVSLA